MEAIGQHQNLAA